MTKLMCERKVSIPRKVAGGFLVTFFLMSNCAYSQMTGGIPGTSHYVFGKNLLVKPVLPAGAPTNPPDPVNHPPVEMDIRVQYEVFQSYCDIQEFGVRDLIPTRTFRGRIGPAGNWIETVPAEDVSTLPSDIPAVKHADTVDLNLSPMKLYSKKATDVTGWNDDHTFVTDMSGGPMVAMNPAAVTSVQIDAITGEVKRVTYRIQIGLQTPAPEYLESDLNKGYEYDQEYKYIVYASTANDGDTVVDTVDVPLYWRRGATYVEVEYLRSFFGDDPEDPLGSASFHIHRQSKKNEEDWNENDPLAEAGVMGSISALFSSLCYASNE